MKLLLDSCVWGGAMVPLRQSGHDVIWAGDWAQDPGDEVILAMAYQDGRILVTIDKDFGELAIVQGTPHCGIIRLVNWRARQQAIACQQVLDRFGQELLAGAIITAEPGRVRIRPSDREGS